MGVAPVTKVDILAHEGYSQPYSDVGRPDLAKIMSYLF